MHAVLCPLRGEGLNPGLAGLLACWVETVKCIYMDNCSGRTTKENISCHFLGILPKWGKIDKKKRNPHNQGALISRRRGKYILKGGKGREGRRRKGLSSK